MGNRLMSGLKRNKFIFAALIVFLAALIAIRLQTDNNNSKLPGGRLRGVQALAFSPADNVPCPDTDSKAKVDTVWYAAFGTRDDATARASSGLDTSTELTDAYESAKLTIAAIVKGIACNEDSLVRSAAESWDNATTSRSLWDSPYSGLVFQTWLYNKTASGPCSGGVPSGNVCTASGDAYNTSNSVICDACSSTIVWVASIILRYVAEISPGSRVAWQTAFVTRWKDIVLQHNQYFIMDASWTYGYTAPPTNTCNGPNSIAVYGTSVVGKEQLFARAAANNWGTGSDFKPSCNAIKDSDLNQAATAAEYLRGNIADAALLPYSGTGITQSTAQMKSFISVVKNNINTKTTYPVLTNFQGTSVNGAVYQPNAYARLTFEGDRSGDVSEAFPPATCVGTYGTVNVTYASGSQDITVANTAGVVLYQRIFATGVDDGTNSQRAVYVSQIVNSTTLRISETTDRGVTITPWLASFDGTRSTTFSVRSWVIASGVGDDVSHHSSSWFYNMLSFRGTNSITGVTDPITDIYMLRSANQVAYGASNKSDTFPRFTNFIDGSNGWYRSGYGPGSIDGYGPWENGSYAGIHGLFWYGLYNNDVYILAARWKVIFQAVSPSADYNWRVDNLSPGGGKWGGCVRSSATHSTSMSRPDNIILFASQIPGPANFGVEGASPTTTTTIAATTTTTTIPAAGNDTCVNTCLFAANANPFAIASGDNNAFSMGFQFTVSVNGYLNAIRFYRHSGDLSTRTVNLLDTSGTILATATSSNLKPGWREVVITNTAVSTGQTYFVTVSSGTNASYAYTYSVFASAVTSGNVTAPADNSSAGTVRNGLYGNLNAKPTSSFNATSYSVDLSYVAGAVPPVTTTTIAGNRIITLIAFNDANSNGVQGLTETFLRRTRYQLLLSGLVVQEGSMNSATELSLPVSSLYVIRFYPPLRATTSLSVSIPNSGNSTISVGGCCVR